MEENKRCRRISTPLLLFLILMGITLALCLTVLGIWLHGRSVLRSKTAEPPPSARTAASLTSTPSITTGNTTAIRTGS